MTFRKYDQMGGRCVRPSIIMLGDNSLTNEAEEAVRREAAVPRIKLYL